MLKGLKKMVTKLLVSVLSEKVLKYVFFSVAKLIVKSTKTKLDDEFLATVEDAYNK